MNLTTPKDSEGFKPNTLPDTALLYADAMSVSRTAKRYQRLAKEMNKQGDPDGMAEIIYSLYRQLDEAQGSLLDLRKAMLDGTV